MPGKDQHSGKNQKKQFVPVKTPRYLIGQVSESIWKKDLDIYNEHRHNIAYAQPTIDTSPPKLDPQSMLKTSKMVLDVMAARRIALMNLELLRKINTINRTSGPTSTFNPRANDSLSKWPSHECKMKAIVKSNRDFYERVAHMGAVYDNKELERDWQHNVQNMKQMSKFPLIIVPDKSFDQILNESASISNIPSTCSISRDRPKVFMNLKIATGSMYIGKLIIELYNDVVPCTAQLFLENIIGMENGISYQNKFFYKIVPGQYCEIGDSKRNIRKPTSMYFQSFPQENFELKHSRPGVVSMVPTTKGNNNLQFSITFAACEHFDDKRVAIGKVIIGNRKLMDMQDLGKKVGKPSEKVYISKCGYYNFPTTSKRYKQRRH